MKELVKIKSLTAIPEREVNRAIIIVYAPAKNTRSLILFEMTWRRKQPKSP
jgi:hypothetical protein